MYDLHQTFIIVNKKKSVISHYLGEVQFCYLHNCVSAYLTRVYNLHVKIQSAEFEVIMNYFKVLYQ